jgi:hypothetical protein
MPVFLPFTPGAVPAPGVKGAGGRLVKSSGTMGDSVPTNGSTALLTVIPQATYSLEGKKTRANIVGIGDVTLKAKRAKDGKSLELTFVHEEKVDTQISSALTSKERWTLFGDGQVLKLQRTVTTQQGAETVNLTFRKKAPAS